MTENEKNLNRINELINLIHKYDYHYYTLSESLITDGEYDVLMKELESLEKLHPSFSFEHSPTKKVGGYTDNQFETIKHKTPMLSLEKANNQEEFDAFINRIEKEIGTFDVTLEPKYDGASLSIVYHNGSLKYAASRGTGGLEGDDVTENVKTIKNLPLYVGNNLSFEVRGEVVISKEDFKEINEQRVLEGLDPYTTARNTASGALRQKHSADASKKPIKFIAFELLDYSGSEKITNHNYKIELLNNLGFQTPKIHSFSSDDDIVSEILKLREEYANMEIDTDGCVVKCKDLAVQKLLGNRTKSPKWAIAYKYEAKEEFVTKLLSVIFQVGKTGQVTPVGLVEPVVIDGTTVKRATLNNINIIDKLGLKIGDDILIIKGNEIIPKIIGVAKTYPESKEIKFPKTCNCPLKGRWALNSDKTLHFCKENTCPSKSSGKLNSAVSKKGLDIGGLGPKTMEKLIDNGLVETLDDLFTLKDKRNLFCSIDGFGLGLFTKITRNIEESKTKGFDRILYALNIPNLGQTNSKLITQKFHNIVLLLNAKYEDFLSIDGIGPLMATSIYDWLQDINNISLVNKLVDLGVVFENDPIESRVEKDSEILKGLNILVTGTFTNGMSRNTVTDLLISNGAEIKKSVSKSLDIIVCGSNPGNSKIVQAEKLNNAGAKIRVMTENEFQAEYKLY